MLDRLPVLWRHISSYAFYLVVTIGALQTAGMDLSWAPHWILVAIGVCGLLSKLIPQGQLPPPAPKVPKLSPYQDEGPGS
jgi:hypothetical protein